MKLAIGCDHGGYALKEALVPFLESMGHTVKDCGCFSADSIDYPDFAFPLSEAVACGEFDRGILVCTTGIGMCICANKVKGIRCALCGDPLSAEMTRRHNDTNMLALGAMVISEETAKRIVEIWLTTDYEGGRHARRVGKISAYENSAR